MADEKLIFVYNADSGPMEAMKDYVHKMVKPATYQCNLCAITYGNFGMKNEWKSFIDRIGMQVDFLHKDEFIINYDMKDTPLPAAFIRKGDELELLVSAEEINEVKSLDELCELVEGKLKGME